MIQFFLALAVLLGTARAFGEVAIRLRQPAILGEILAGILLGPTVMGRMAPGLFASVFPQTGGFPAAFEAFTTVAIALFLMTAGMEVDLSTVWRQGKTAVTVALCALVPAFVVGITLGRFFPDFMGALPDTKTWVFALFLATAMSICALPVIIKILIDLNIFRSDLGMIVVSSATLLDLIGWNLFAVVISMAGAGGGHFDVGLTVVFVFVFVAFMLTLGRWVFHRVLPWLQAHTSYPAGVLGFTFAGAMACAAFTEWIGIHAIFGAFIFGVALGDSTHLRSQTRTMIEQFVGFIFAPIFFASIGLKVDFLANLDPVLTLVVLAVGSAGMIAGGTTGARFSGLQLRESLAIGIAMNTRGAMEIILGLLALRHGIIGERLFVALVIIAIATSLASGSMIQRVLGRRRQTRFHDFLSSRTFSLQLAAESPTDAIVELCRLAADAHGLDADRVSSLVLKREEASSTALPGGFALPHARLAGLKAPVVAIGRSRRGIDFDAPDGKPARLVFLILTPEDDHQTQLEILADITTVFTQAKMVDRTLRAANYTEFLAVIKRETPPAGHA